jgi:predicted ester cyclase
MTDQTEESKALLRRITDEIWTGGQLESVREAFPDYREILWLGGEGDRAVSLVRGSGTHLGRLQGMEPTGRSSEWHAMGALRFADGQAVERWGIGDSMAMMQQLGVFG